MLTLSQGCEFFSAADYVGLLPAQKLASELETMRRSYDELELDPHMKDGGRYRFRRFGRFSLDTEEGKLRALAAAPFFQSVRVNSLNGGAARVFAPLQERTLANGLLQAIIRFQLSRVPGRDLTRLWNIGVHQIRITGNPGETGKPTPEGIHQDGDDYVGMVLFSRTNVAGGESRIYDSGKRLRAKLTLSNPLDSLLVDDRANFHEVTSIASLDKSSAAVRDMLVIEFNPEGRTRPSAVAFSR